MNTSGPLGARIEGSGDRLGNLLNTGGLVDENVVKAGSEDLLGISKSPRGELVVEGGLPPNASTGQSDSRRTGNKVNLRGTGLLNGADESLVDEGHHVGVGQRKGASHKGGKNDELQTTR